MAIASGGDTRLKAIEIIYQLTDVKGKVMQYVKTHGGSQTEGLDIFHDGIVALDQNIRSGKYRSEGPLQGYLYTICRFIWNNEYRRRMKISSGDIQEFQLEPDDSTPEVKLRSKEEAALLDQVLQLLDESCRKILTLWKLSYSMTEIATTLQLSSPELAKKYRFRCMQKLMDQLEQRPGLMNTLKNV